VQPIILYVKNENGFTKSIKRGCVVTSKWQFALSL
jgi:hypothetical protein